jgi:hypothetical protein
VSLSVTVAPTESAPLSASVVGGCAAAEEERKHTTNALRTRLMAAYPREKSGFFELLSHASSAILKRGGQVVNRRHIKSD